MNYIFIDFEMNPIERQYKEARQICKREIIEIGAVMLSADYKEIDAFKCYVKPTYSKSISKKYQKLTGITDDMLEDALTFKDALSVFVEWCMSKGKNFEIYAWSENDLIQLTEEMCLKQVELMDEIHYILGHWHDFQRTFCNLLGLYKPISLKTAIGAMGRKFVGQVHDALWDARNTAYIYSLSKDTDTFYQVMKPIIELLQPEEHYTCRLGELFNFDELLGRGSCESVG